MTQLMNLYMENPEAAKKKIEEMDAELLLAELDDTIQFDLMKMSTPDYISLPHSRAAVYRVIAKEILDRLIKARAGQTWADNGYAGHYDSNGRKMVDFEPGTDADLDRYSVQVQNGEGYYAPDGKFHYYHDDE